MSIDAAQAASDLLTRGRKGDVVAIGQLMTALEAESSSARECRREVHAAGGNAHVIGITGAAGSGKSVLVGSMAAELRSRGLRVGVVAIDPSSSLSGGAIMGDRIRMQQHSLDPGVYVRSVSSRGWLGGVSRSTIDLVAVLDAVGWDVVIVETVGVGQAEVEIVGIAHTVVVVSIPGTGDDIQAIKAGLLEVADIHVVNKADLPEANKTAAELSGMLTLAGLRDEGGWAVPVLRTSGLGGMGVSELTDTATAHLDWLRGSGEYESRLRRSAASRIDATAKDLLVQRMRGADHRRDFEDAVDEVVARRTDSQSAAAELIGRVLNNPIQGAQ